MSEVNTLNNNNLKHILFSIRRIFSILYPTVYAAIFFNLVNNKIPLNPMRRECWVSRINEV